MQHLIGPETPQEHRAGFHARMATAILGGLLASTAMAAGGRSARAQPRTGGNYASAAERTHAKMRRKLAKAGRRAALKR